MVLVLPVDPADAGDVARDGHLVVRDALGHPYGAHLVAAAADDFEGPYFFLIGHRQALAGVAVAVFLGGFAHQADGVAGVVAAHQRESGELLDEEHRVLVDEGVRAREGGLAHGELLLVQAGIARIDIGVGVADFGDLAHLLDAGGVALELRVPEALEDLEHVAFLMVDGGFHRNPGVRDAVAGVGSDDGTVRGGEPAHHDAGAALGLVAVGVDALRPGACGNGQRRHEKDKTGGFHACHITFLRMYAFSCT